MAQVVTMTLEQLLRLAGAGTHFAQVLANRARGQLETPAWRTAAPPAVSYARHEIARVERRLEQVAAEVEALRRGEFEESDEDFGRASVIEHLKGLDKEIKRLEIAFGERCLGLADEEDGPPGAAEMLREWQDVRLDRAADRLLRRIDGDDEDDDEDEDEDEDFMSDHVPEVAYFAEGPRPAPAPPPPPRVNAPSFLMPAVHIQMPEQPAPVVHVHVPEQPAPVVNVEAPRSPVVNVQVPEQKAPVVNVNVPKQPAPQVTVNVPEQPAPVVNVEAPAAKGRKVSFDRNIQGEITRATVTEG